MDIWVALILALVQGLTEFLPISSSAHLILPHEVLGWPNQGTAFDVMVHLGTLFAVLVYLRKDVFLISKDCLGVLGGKPNTDNSKLGWLVVLATIPAVIFGYAIDRYLDLRSAWIIASTTIIFGLLLWYADRASNTDKKMNQLGWQQALIIGFAQVLALIPGTSRSGITMTAALLLGFKREVAAKFSFLLSIPIILAASSLKILDLVTGEATGYTDFSVLVIGVIASFVTALLCIVMFMKFIEQLGFLPFVIYRLLLGTFLFGLLWLQ